MPDLSKHPILQQISDLIHAIEVCGASPALTKAVCMAEALYKPAEALVDSKVSTIGHFEPLTDPEMELAVREAEADFAPRVTNDQIDALSSDLKVHTHHFPGTTTTVAVAVLPDGFVVATGHSACISAANFKKDVGEQFAASNALAAARTKLWELECYRLRASLLKPHAYIGGGAAVTDTSY